MYPELFEIPFVHMSIKSYGLMMVIGFVLMAIFREARPEGIRVPG